MMNDRKERYKQLTGRDWNPIVEEEDACSDGTDSDCDIVDGNKSKAASHDERHLPACRQPYTEGELFQEEKEAEYTTGYAFVTFRRSAHMNAVVDIWQRGGVAALLRYMSFNYKLSSQCCSPPPLFLGEHRLHVTRAPEPSEINWENFEISNSNRMMRLTLSYLCTLVIVGLAAVAIVFTERARDNATKETVGTDFTTKTKIYGITVGAAIGVTVTNMVASFIVQHLTDWELHVVKTEFETSFFVKLFFAYVMNTTALAFIIKDVDEWYIQGGLVETGIYVMVANAVIPDLMEIIRPTDILMRWWYGRKCLTQRDLNRVFAPPEYHIAERYAAVCRTIALALLYVIFVVF